MSYEKLCDEIMLLTPQIAASVVEHRDGYRVCERIRKEIIKIDEERKLYGLMLGAQLVEAAKGYKKELGNIQVIIHHFENLLSFIFPLKDNHSLIIAVAPGLTEFKPLVTNVREIIKAYNLMMI